MFSVRESVDADRGHLSQPEFRIREDNDPEQKRSFFGVTQDQNSLGRLTLRQLRLKASDLGIPMYSRKTKAALI